MTGDQELHLLKASYSRNGRLLEAEGSHELFILTASWTRCLRTLEDHVTTPKVLVLLMMAYGTHNITSEGVDGPVVTVSDLDF